MGNVLYERNEGISYITLNRPDHYNALDAETLQELAETVKDVAENDDQVLILTGNGKAFSAGGDMHMLNNDFADKELFNQVMDTIETTALTLYHMPKMIISAVNGSAAGLGLSLALAADYVVANEKSKFGMLFLGVGLVPDGGGHFWLEERMDRHQAKKFIWSMKQVQGESAKSLGLADVLIEGDVMVQAEKLGQKLLRSPLQAMLHTKRVYRSKRENVFKQYLAQEKQAQWELKNTADHKEGVSAFLEKRKPEFQGK